MAGSSLATFFHWLAGIRSMIDFLPSIEDFLLIPVITLITSIPPSLPLFAEYKHGGILLAFFQHAPRPEANLKHLLVIEDKFFYHLILW